MRYVLVLAAVLAALAGAAPAHGTAGPDQRGGPSPAEIAERACAQLRDRLGDAFETRVGTPAACAAKLEPAIRAALAACSAASGPGSDAFRTCMEGRVQAAVRDLTGGAPDVEEAVRRICAAIERKLGAEKFAQRFDDGAACRKELEPTARAGLRACAKEGKPGSAEFKRCLNARIKEKVAGAGASKAVERVTAQACTSLERQLGRDRFAQRFGSKAGCLSKVGPVAQRATNACAKKARPGSDAFKKCIQAELRAALARR